jgi:hypothetical protein
VQSGGEQDVAVGAECDLSGQIHGAGYCRVAVGEAGCCRSEQSVRTEWSGSRVVGVQSLQVIKSVQVMVSEAKGCCRVNRV